MRPQELDTNHDGTIDEAELADAVQQLITEQHNSMLYRKILIGAA